jgi:hypothetical protein
VEEPIRVCAFLCISGDKRWELGVLRIPQLICVVLRLKVRFLVRFFLICSSGFGRNPFCHLIYIDTTCWIDRILQTGTLIKLMFLILVFFDCMFLPIPFAPPHKYNWNTVMPVFFLYMKVALQSSHPMFAVFFSNPECFP